MNNPVRILHVVTYLDTGGISSFLYNYYIHMDHSKIHMDIVGIDRGSDHSWAQKFRNLGVNVYYMPQKYQQRLAYLLKLLKHNRYDIVHSHIELLSSVYLIVAMVSGVKVRIAHAHQAFHNYHSAKERSMQIVLNCVSTDKWGCSQEAIKCLFGKDNVDKKNVIYNAVDLDYFSYNEVLRNNYRQELRINDKFVIGFSGRLTFAKNLPFLIDVFYAYKQRFSNAVLLIVGGGRRMGLYCQ